jgi:hypothetical protein
MKKFWKRQRKVDPKQQRRSIQRTYIGIGIAICWMLIAGVACNFLTASQPTDRLLSDALFPIVRDNKVGYIDINGKIAIPPKFPLMKGSCQGHWCYSIRDQYRYSPNSYNFSDGLASVSFDQGWGYIDKKGNTKIAPQSWESLGDFKDGLAKITFKFLSEGFIDTNGKIIGEFEKVNDFHEGLAFVSVKGKWGAIDQNGKMVIAPQFRDVRDFHEGLAYVKLDSHNIGFIDKNTKKIFKIGLSYPVAYENFKDGFVMVRFSSTDPQTSDNGISFVFLDKQGKVLADRRFQLVEQFNEGLAAIKIDGKWGFIDKNGKTIVKTQFQAVGDFHEELAAVKINDKWGFIDKNGNIVIPPQFEDVNQYTQFAQIGEQSNGFKYGVARVKIKDKWGYIDKTGKVVIAAKFDSAYEFDALDDGLASIAIDGRWGWIDRAGKIVIKPQFLDRYYFEDGLVSVKSEPNILDFVSDRADKYGYIDRAGRYVWNPSN